MAATGFRSKVFYHAIALFTALVWGLTFVSTKVLIHNGLAPMEIFIIRFVIAYICTLPLCHSKLCADSKRDEFRLMLAGVLGGSLYFLAENTALKITFAENVSLIICSAPILTIILGSMILRDKIKRGVWIGSCIAFIGVAMVVMSSALNYGINPLGDLLTFMAALMWALYSIIVDGLGSKYSNLFITRKIFFYGFATALPYFIFYPPHIALTPNSMLPIVGNLLFLSIIASFVCFLMWNAAIKGLGPEITTNYIYLSPLATIFASVVVLGEPLTLPLLIGTVLVIGGVALSNK